MYRSQTARKTFESYALSLGISSKIRFKLLEHADPTIKRHYQKWDWIELVKQIHEAHDKVVETYRSKTLYNQLIYKANEILEDQGYDKVLFRKNQLYSLER